MQQGEFQMAIGWADKGSTPYNFLGYWKSIIKTKQAFIDNYVSVGDLAYRNNTKK